MSKSSVIVLSIVLLTGISLVPALQIGVNGQVQQQQPLQQQNQVNLSQAAKQIVQQVSNATPGTNATEVHQILESEPAPTAEPGKSALFSSPTTNKSEEQEIIDLIPLPQREAILDKKTSLQLSPSELSTLIQGTKDLVSQANNLTLLENILEATPSIDIKSEINAILKVEPSSLSIEENTPTKMVVSGTLTYINNSGINDEVIPISIGSPGQKTYEYKRNAHTDDKGIYEVDFDDVRLPKGTYEIVARPANDNYSELSASTQFLVESHPLSFNDIFPYLAASGIIIGIVSVIPRWYIRKRERKNLTQYMIKIHDEYNKFSKSKEIDYLSHLSGLRMELIEILKEGKINEAQYEMLDKKISDYIDRVSKDVYKLTK
jgi:hypothetical protein